MKQYIIEIAASLALMALTAFGIPWLLAQRKKAIDEGNLAKAKLMDFLIGIFVAGAQKEVLGAPPAGAIDVPSQVAEVLAKAKVAMASEAPEAFKKIEASFEDKALRRVQTNDANLPADDIKQVAYELAAPALEALRSGAAGKAVEALNATP